jgi:uncharacterized membrane protein YdbT with pleckstrin-like domain
MKYVEEVLQPGERILFVSTIHWFIYAPAAILLLIGLAFGVGGLGSSNPVIWQMISLLILATGAVSAVSAWFKRWTTEIAVTDRRIIYKRGFIRRRTIEMNMEKVESVDVNQSIPGRIFGYGDVLIRGVGVGFEPLHMVDDPIQLRNAVTAK